MGKKVFLSTPYLDAPELSKQGHVLHDTQRRQPCFNGQVFPAVFTHSFFSCVLKDRISGFQLCYGKHFKEHKNAIFALLSTDSPI